MEQVGQILKREQPGTNLQKLSTQPLINDDDNSSISIYSGELSPETIAKSLAQVKVAFPALPKGFFTLLTERFMEKGFSNKRVIDAINNVIDTCQYPTPTLANFLAFDKRVNVYDYNKVCSMVIRQEVKFNDFSKVRKNGNIFFVKNRDKVLYNIPDEI